LVTWFTCLTGLFEYQAYIELYLSRNQDLLLGATSNTLLDGCPALEEKASCFSFISF